MRVHVHVYPHGRDAKNSTEEDDLHVERCLNSPPQARLGGSGGACPPSQKCEALLSVHPPNFVHTLFFALSQTHMAIIAHMCIHICFMHMYTSHGSCGMHLTPYHV